MSSLYISGDIGSVYQLAGTLLYSVFDFCELGFQGYVYLTCSRLLMMSSDDAPDVQHGKDRVTVDLMEKNEDVSCIKFFMEWKHCMCESHL